MTKVSGDLTWKGPFGFLGFQSVSVMPRVTLIAQYFAPGPNLAIDTAFTLEPTPGKKVALSFVAKKTGRSYFRELFLVGRAKVKLNPDKPLGDSFALSQLRHK